MILTIHGMIIPCMTAFTLIKSCSIKKFTIASYFHNEALDNFNFGVL